MGAGTAALSAGLSCGRTIASGHTHNPWVMLFFLLLVWGLGILRITEPVQWLPILGTTIGAWGLFRTQGLPMQLCMLAGGLCWTSHNILIGSIGGCLIETTFLFVNGHTMYRMWRQPLASAAWLFARNREMTQQIAVIGECMVELRRTAQGLLSQGFGGDTLNTALYLARLGRQLGEQELRVHYITGLGPDSLSEQMVSDWQQEGIDTDWVQRLADKAPGLYLIDTDASGERSFTYWRNDAAARYWLERKSADAILAALGRCQFIYLSGISLAILPAASRQRLLTALATARAQGARLVFDNNYRPRLWADKEEARATYGAMLAQTDIALLTHDDEMALWGDESLEQTITRNEMFGIGEIVLKCGAEPCLIVRGESRIEVPALALDPARIVDTTAAGDSFSAGYLAARLRGAEVAESAQAGHHLAATVIQHPGAIIPLAAMPAANTSHRKESSHV